MECFILYFIEIHLGLAHKGSRPYRPVIITYLTELLYHFHISPYILVVCGVTFGAEQKRSDCSFLFVRIWNPLNCRLSTYHLVVRRACETGFVFWRPGWKRNLKVRLWYEWLFCFLGCIQLSSGIACQVCNRRLSSVGIVKAVHTILMLSFQPFSWIS